MKNSTAVEVASIPSSENYLDRDFLNDIQNQTPYHSVSLRLTTLHYVLMMNYELRMMN